MAAVAPRSDRFVSMQSPSNMLRKAGSIEGDERRRMDTLFSRVYGELRILARGYLRHDRAGHELETTELMHEAFLRLGEADDQRWESRTHFLRAAAAAMRHVLVDRSRRRGARKRGGHAVGRRLDEATVSREGKPGDLACLDWALTKLGPIDRRMARVVELRFFVGLTIEETAEVLGVSSGTVKHDWRRARALLRSEIRKDRKEGAAPAS